MEMASTMKRRKSSVLDLDRLVFNVQSSQTWYAFDTEQDTTDDGGNSRIANQNYGSIASSLPSLLSAEETATTVTTTSSRTGLDKAEAMYNSSSSDVAGAPPSDCQTDTVASTSCDVPKSLLADVGVQDQQSGDFRPARKASLAMTVGAVDMSEAFSWPDIDKPSPSVSAANTGITGTEPVQPALAGYRAQQLVHDNGLRKLTELSSRKIKRKHKETVFVHIVFLKVGEIDTLKETFCADLFIQARWREQLLDHQPDLDVDWSTYWNPHLYVDNCAEPAKENIWYTVMFTENMEAYIFERRRINGTFIENLELNQFPFDTQDVTVTVVSERSVCEVAIAEDYSELSTVNVQSFVDEQEWRLYSNVEVHINTVVRIYQGDNCCHSSISTLCHASRRVGFYLWNILFVMMFITSMALLTFSIDSSKRENRLQVTFILLLATVTFKFAVSSSLPRISYLTYLDVYILSSMSFMGAICLWHSIVPHITAVDNYYCDIWALFVFGVVFFSAQVSFFTFIYFKALRSRRRLVEQEKIHQERIATMELNEKQKQSRIVRAASRMR